MHRSSVLVALMGATLASAPAEARRATPPAATAPARPVGLVPEGHGLLMVMANAVPGQEAGFDTWYDGHMKSISKLPEVIRVQRFKMAPRAGKPDPAFGYVILYEYAGTADQLNAALGAAAKEGRISIPDKNYVLKTEGSTWQAVTPGYAKDQ